MSFLLVSDLHLTDRPADEYRWGLFPKIRELTDQDPCEAVIIAGDLTDAKDRHSAVLTNRIADELTRLHEADKVDVYVLRGNHDCVDPDLPFFRFLNHVPGVRVISQPRMVIIDDARVMMIPHTRDPEKDWADLDFGVVAGADYVLLHQTFARAIGENGRELDGLPASLFDDCEPGRVFSGDIHVPQRVGPVEYIGAPYHIHFGDSYTPRALYFAYPGARREINWDFPRKLIVTVDAPSGLRALVKRRAARAGDQVKVILSVAPERAVEWNELRRQVVDVCAELSLILASVRVEVKRAKRDVDAVAETPTKVRSVGEDFDRFVAVEGIAGRTLETGRKLLETDGA